ncbi:MAG: DUF6746 family protein [Pseudidiomarina maritima]|uniref:DUF6746 family protein n=2 Tax=Pseudidiomarina TaxID=2800384 RepID=A0AB39X9G8_9GAMM|nr:DUF6746 family protein [Pseudidiomarina sp. GXY010]MDT7525066.1 hypothetical protein [Pseudidiomarina sp. GXY010]MDX1524951.1 DUF6746 family protein [Pseudidiomarina maritima]
MTLFKQLTSASIAVILASGVAFAPASQASDDRPDHFKGKPSENLEQALDNLREYNKKLAEVLNGELTPQKMGEIHQLTYTLEVALQRLETEVDDLQDVLEEVHKGSEHMDFDKVKKNGKQYLQTSGKIVD